MGVNKTRLGQGWKACIFHCCTWVMATTDSAFILVNIKALWELLSHTDTDLHGLGSRVPAPKHTIAAFLEQKVIPRAEATAQALLFLTALSPREVQEPC